MIIFKIGDSWGVPLTIDTTLVTIDSTNITVDQTEVGNFSWHFNVNLRFYSESFKITIRKEINNHTIEIDTPDHIIKGNYLKVYFDYPDYFTENGKYEVVITDNVSNRVMYKGMGFSTSNDDLENYKVTELTPNKKIKI